MSNIFYTKKQIWGNAPLNFKPWFGEYVINNSVEGSAIVYAPGETVEYVDEVSAMRYVSKPGYKNGYRCQKVMFCGREFLTIRDSKNSQAEAPDFCYEVIPVFHKIYFKDEVRLHKQPIEGPKKDTKLYTGKAIYTIGKTADGWYKVFEQGVPLFIREDNAKIERIEEDPEYPEIKIYIADESDKENILKRVKYQLGLLPYPVMDILLEKNLIITITDDPASYYSNYYDGVAGAMVYDMEKDEYHVYSFERKTDYEGMGDTLYLETSLLHEIGHALDYMLDGASDMMSDAAFEELVPLLKEVLLFDDENPDTYEHAIKSRKEYFANAFNCYVHYPELLSYQAPLTDEFMTLSIANHLYQGLKKKDLTFFI